MAIGTAAAILGSAVIGAGASALTSAKAAKTAANASNYAADQNAAVNREIYNQTRQDLAPYNAAGQASLAALMGRLGISLPSAQPGAGAGNAQAQAAVDYGRVLADRPDVLAAYQREASRDAKSQANLASLGIDSPEAYAEWWLKNKPPEDTYTPPTVASAQPQVLPANDQPAEPLGAQPGYELMTASRPEAPAAPTFTRQADLQAPSLPTFDYRSIEDDPGFQWEMDKTLDGVNAYSAARGKLRSGDAAMALAKEASGLSHRFTNDYFGRQMQLYNAAQDAYRFQQGRNDLLFENDRGYGTDAYRWGVNRNDSIFDTDRGYQTDRYDQGVSNLFGLVGVGQNAAAGTSAAGNVFANNTINSNNQRAATTANAAIANAGNISNLFGSAAQAVGTYYGMRGNNSRGAF